MASSQYRCLGALLGPPQPISRRTDAVLGILATILAVVGVWIMVANATSRRTREIGIRKAPGASTREILIPLLRQATKLASIGLAIGLALGAAASQVLFVAGLLFG